MVTTKNDYQHWSNRMHPDNFRVYDATNKKYVEKDISLYSNGTAALIKIESQGCNCCIEPVTEIINWGIYKFEYSTGLLDKNGIEIFENDIIIINTIPHWPCAVRTSRGPISFSVGLLCADPPCYPLIDFTGCRLPKVEMEIIDNMNTTTKLIYGVWKGDLK